MTVRSVTPNDFERLCVLTEKMMKESPFYSKLKFSADMLTFFMKEAIKDPNRYYLRVIEKDGQVVGGMFCHWCMPIFSCDRMSEDFSLFVDKEYRGRVGKGVLKLIHGYFEWAKENDVKIATLGILAGIDAGTVSRMYEKLSIPFVGYLHARSL